MSETKRRILIIDDSEAIHTDFRRVLCPKPPNRGKVLDLMEEELFGEDSSREVPSELEFEVDSAFQGQEALAMVRQAQEAGRPYDLAFLDYRMPPGWNGLETLRHLRRVAPSLPVVLCSAYSDYSWEEILREFGESQLLEEMRKPFDSQELRQRALAHVSSSAAP
ncbi:MAG: response regulator [Myxococcaceae bacterium]|nr:response regulator [Myxococcaceae bacterium]